ncbi:MAG: peptidylprolyl isomerase [Candidatus Binataceae bacterium]
MKHKTLRGFFGCGLAARAVVLSGALMLALGGAGCASSGLHLPGGLWSGKNKSSARAPATLGTLPAGAADYAPQPQAPPSGEMLDSVVANVDGDPITSRDVQTFKPGKAGSQPGQSGEDADAAPDEPGAKLKAIITQQLIQDEAQKYADKVDDADVDRFIQGIEQRTHMNDEQLHAQLQAQGISYPAFRANVRKQVQAMAMFEHEVRDKAVIPDAEIETYYKEHPDEFVVAEEKYRLAQILITVPSDAKPEQVAAAQSKAETIRAQAVKSGDFAGLARQFSDDDSKSKGGELGVFSADQLNDDIAAGLKDVKVGDISKVIRTKYGFHIVKVEAHQVPGTVPLADVKSQIREKLQSEQSKGNFDKWVDQDLVKEHYVETTR